MEGRYTINEESKSSYNNETLCVDSLTPFLLPFFPSVATSIVFLQSHLLLSSSSNSQSISSSVLTQQTYWRPSRRGCNFNDTRLKTSQQSSDAWQKTVDNSIIQEELIPLSFVVDFFSILFQKKKKSECVFFRFFTERGWNITYNIFVQYRIHKPALKKKKKKKKYLW